VCSFAYTFFKIHRQWEKFSPTPEKKRPGSVGFTSGKFKEDVVVLEMREYTFLSFL